MTSTEILAIGFVLFWLIIFLAALVTVARTILALIRLGLRAAWLPFRLLKRISPL